MELLFTLGQDIKISKKRIYSHIDIKALEVSLY
jgi:hypothetical protein